MTDEQREAYKRAFAVAEKRLRKGQRIHHARWNGVHLETMASAATGDLAPNGSTIPELPQRQRSRGLVQEDLGL